LSLRALRAALAIAWLAGCRGEHDQARRAEAARILRAIELLRDAPNAAKAEQLDRLERQACSDPELCALKSHCVQSYETHVSAVQRIEGARRGLGSDATTHDLAAAAAAMRAAQAELEHAQPGIRRCTERSGELRRRIGG
jgi:hypothetical protein